MASAPVSQTGIAQFGYSIDLDGLDLGALLKPVPTATPEQRKRRHGAGQGNSMAQNFLMLSPLTLLAACGGGGGGVAPPPPPPATGFTGTADTGAVTAGAAALSVAAPGVLGNDTATGGTATISAVAAGTTAGAGNVGVAVNGALGALNLASTGSYTYTVANNAAVQALGQGVTRTDVFTYTGSVGSSTGSTTLTITVTGVNDAPVATNDVANAVIGGAVVTANVLTNDSDPDRDASGAAQTLTVTAVGAGTTAPASGGVGTAIAGTLGTLNVAANGSYTYTPNAAGTATTDTFSYRVSDGVTSSTATLTVSFPASFGTSVTLAGLNGTNGGISITGPGGSSEFGASIALGNVTGAGPSIVVGAPGFDSGATNNLGRVYILGANGSLTGATVIDGVAADARLGQSIDIGNIGGSATADIIIGSPGAAPGGVANQGAAYILFGGATIATNLAGLNGTNGFLVSGSSNNTGGAYTGLPLADPGANDNLGYVVKYLGDINGDGRADYLISAPGFNSNGTTAGTDAGAAVVGYGLTNYAAAGYTLTDYVSTTSVIGFVGRIDASSGTDREYVATDAASGRLNATTNMLAYSSALIDAGAGAATPGSNSGQVNIVLSSLNPQGGFLDTGAAGFNGTTGYRVTGALNDKLGTSLAIGDVDGDGIGDLVIGAPGNNAVYVLYNISTATGPNIDLSTLTGNSGTIAGVSVVKLTGAAGSLLGSDLAVGDFNGDGRADIAVSSDGTGDAHIIFGRTSVGLASLATTPLGTTGILSSVVFVDGPAPTGPNYHLTLSAGDVNGDARADLAIGASSTGGAGAAYVVYGAATPVVTSASLDATPIVDSAPATVDSILDGLGVGLGGQRSGGFAVSIDLPILVGTDFTRMEDMHTALTIHAA